MATRTVGELLQAKDDHVFTISPEASVQEALELMVVESISSLPVTRGAELVGIVSERDYIRKAVPRRLVPWEIRVQEIMTQEVMCVTRSNSIQECMELMTSNRIRHLPVVEGRTLVGMLSISDIVRALRPARIDFPEPLRRA
jgi:CBS domain-containing protein